MTVNGGTARSTGRRWLWICAGLAGLGAIAAAVGIWHLPDRMYPGTTDGAVQARAALQGGLLTAAAALTAVAGALIALDETRQANAETKRANETSDARERAANANTHVREFYVAAIGLLSADTVDSRLGGIYALERITVDSPADQRTVVEVLSAFVREHARPPTAIPGPEQQPRRPATDVQAALTVLGRLPIRDDVSRADLTGAHLTGARLDRATLTGAWLEGANLTGARADRATLTGAWMDGANLTDANVDGANLTGAWLGEANLTGAGLHEANLTDAWLGGANLTGAWLGEANLTGAGLHGANLTDAWLGDATLTGAGLGEANLTGARLEGANLTGARFLLQQQVDVAGGDGGTRLPAGLVRPASWGPEEPDGPPGPA